MSFGKNCCFHNNLNELFLKALTTTYPIYWLVLLMHTTKNRPLRPFRTLSLKAPVWLPNDVTFAPFQAPSWPR